MIIQVKGKQLKEGAFYRGIISEHKITDSKLIICVIFDKDAETEYIKSIRIEDNVNSAFVNLAKSLDLFDENGNIDTDYLEDLHVKANLQRGYDERLYIDKLEIDDKYYASQKEAEE
ncbi:MAG: hypothetical protein K2L07_13455 [Lachnospiraceae bacterium]|nr:hypothetical protein [Lachnospiraceae bacterium]